MVNIINTLREEYKTIAEFMGYMYCPFSSEKSIQNKYYPGWFKCSEQEVRDNLNGNYGVLTYSNPNYICRNTLDLRFSTDIRRLMKVVDKIESIRSEKYGRFIVRVEGNQCDIFCYPKVDGVTFSVMSLCKYREESIYSACLNFIKKYNEYNN